MTAQQQRPGRWCMLTVVGNDRSGIVARLTDALYRGGFNLGEASMVRLGGNFTVMLMVEAGDPAALETLLQPVAAELGLRLHVDSIQGDLHHHLQPNVQVIAHGADRPGIIAQVTGALATIGFNILDLSSDVGGSPERPIYFLNIDGHVAGGVDDTDRILAPLRAQGIEVRITALDTLIG